MLKQEIEKALTVLKNGGVILYPTDTIWGLGCDATNQEAVEKISKLKGRDQIKVSSFYWIMTISCKAMSRRYLKLPMI